MDYYKSLFFHCQQHFAVIYYIFEHKFCEKITIAQIRRVHLLLHLFMLHLYNLYLTNRFRFCIIVINSIIDTVSVLVRLPSAKKTDCPGQNAA